MPQGSKIAVVLSGACLILASPRSAAPTRNPGKLRVTVADTIRMTTFDESVCAEHDMSGSRFVCFSPDGKQFVVVTRRGNPETNQIQYSLLLFETANAFQHPQPKLLVSMYSRSNRDAIKNVKWVGNETLYFIGEADGRSQVRSINVATHAMRQWSWHPTAVVGFDIDAKGDLIYAAEPRPPTEQSVARKIDHGFAITNETLGEIPRSKADFREPDEAQGEEVFVKRDTKTAVRVNLRDRYLPYKPISIAPDGRHAVLAVLARDVPSWWKDYQDDLIQAEVRAYRRKGTTSWLMRYMLVDLNSGSVKPLLEGPIAWSSGATAWCSDATKIAVSGAFLPLDIADSPERDARSKHAFTVEVDVETGHFEKISDKNLVVIRWDTKSDRVFFRGANSSDHASYLKHSSGWVEESIGIAADVRTGLPHIMIDQDLNTSPRLYAADADPAQKVLLLDPNPEFAKFAFARVETVHWKASDGHEVEGGLYFPPDYQEGLRYPLVIQTHGFSNREFWINGPWNSAFAAQPLAAHDIVVLQVGHGTEAGGYMKHHRSLEEAPREMAAYEGAIDYLDTRGIIDRDKVGIIGFSRTQYHVEFTLTHSSYHFAAATLADGFDGGYLQYLADPYSEKDHVFVNGGPPFGETFSNWLKHSPSFRIDRVHTPVRVECYGEGIFGCWEWFSALTHLSRPVDLIYLPDAVHLLVKPWERLTSQQGNVDWFCFWLKSEEDNDAAKQEEYERWRVMRTMESPPNEANSACKECRGARGQ